MSRLLISEKPLMVIPSLAQKIGLNEAIILQQIHYWLQISQHHNEGRKWVFNTYKDWQLQFPFWSESTIKRTIKSLEEQGYVISANFNRFKMDKTKWYTIDYEKVEALEMEELISQDSTIVQDETSSESFCQEEECVVNQAIPESTTENTSENKNNIPFSEIITYLNDQANTSYKPGTKKTKDLITTRWNEGFRLEDFKRVIDLKAQEWLHDCVWNKYLRPETLFGPKFESYCNQKSATKKIYCEGDFNLDD
ncbi:conserved phage C-terminal domain-containing protein [Bacillus tuaregi]|uniref:conserved phage C-terminal domain-containing protein n=1 Tax=Bacillus tuaregi TaxID=1816695 RepID=UPI0008F7EB65|nr:conserved phage C-terminal domain-containing protein [Bacillus tuaregi]